MLPKWLIQNNKDWNKKPTWTNSTPFRAEMANPEQQGLKRQLANSDGAAQKAPKWLIQNNKDWNLILTASQNVWAVPKWLIQNNKDWNPFTGYVRVLLR